MYAQPSDMVARFGQVEIDQLSDPDNTGSPVTSYVTQALIDASTTIDSYISGRYRDVMPFATIPQALPMYCCAIARYQLYTGGNKRPTDEVTRLYKDAISWLGLVQRGEITLGIPDPNPDEGTLIEGDEVLVSADHRMFRGRRLLG